MAGAPARVELLTVVAACLTRLAPATRSRVLARFGGYPGIWKTYAPFGDPKEQVLRMAVSRNSVGAAR